MSNNISFWKRWTEQRFVFFTIVIVMSLSALISWNIHVYPFKYMQSTIIVKKWYLQHIRILCSLGSVDAMLYALKIPLTLNCRYNLFFLVWVSLKIKKSQLGSKSTCSGFAYYISQPDSWKNTHLIFHV